MTNANKGALTEMLSYDEKLRLMTLSVLREECGRELSKKAYYENTAFDWKTHNDEFNEDYGDLSTKELLGLCKKYYGLNSLDEVRPRKAKHREQYNSRTRNY